MPKTDSLNFKNRQGTSSWLPKLWQNSSKPQQNAANFPTARYDQKMFEGQWCLSGKIQSCDISMYNHSTYTTFKDDISVCSKTHGQKPQHLECSTINTIWYPMLVHLEYTTFSNIIHSSFIEEKSEKWFLLQDFLSENHSLQFSLHKTKWIWLQIAIS